ncbi:toll-like receptor 6 [Panonychus citri]|uniref:toll-like receptor 6 n=1 Tax=Panonychus citri TaxID=50023 RepID=UPI0023078514|nr:toll-like receptor 6 [Panonychus citri]
MQSINYLLLLLLLFWTNNLGLIVVKVVDCYSSSSSSILPSSLSPSSELIQDGNRPLESIDLSFNGMSSVPDELFCQLSNLAVINLSNNLFTDVVSIGFSSSVKGSGQNSSWSHCSVNSTSQLDLSYNRLKVLTDRGFSTLTHLKVLRLNNNRISRAEESSLNGLSELALLDLSNNELVALPPGFFTPIKSSLRELYLQNNSISVLPPLQFNGLQWIHILNMSHNEIANNWINVDTFADLTSLVTLDLSYNQLNKIDSTTFRAQTRLEALYLHHNKIESIADNAFSSLNNLQQLVLSYNHLNKLDSAECFTGLKKLPSLHLDHNRIEQIHNEIFRNLTSLMDLNLSHNWLKKTVPGAMLWTHSLRNLDLSYNSISEIGNASYQGNAQLYSLDLEGNQIGNLSRGVFADLPFLRIINLAANRIEAIEESTFIDVPDLHVLRLDSNSLSNINELFNGLRDLLMLNISANKIAWFDYAHVPYGLQWLDIHDNLIDSLENLYELQSSLRLKTLDASFNKITHLSKASLPNGIEVILLNNNLINRIDPSTFLGKQNLTRVDLTSNRLNTLHQNALRLSKVALRRPLPEFNISKNPFRCDCNIEWLQKMITTDESRQYPKIVDVNHIMCDFAFKKKVSPMPLVQADSSNFLCTYKSHCFALCHCCDFDACDCEMMCPENCVCYYDQAWNTNSVDCSANGHTVVPPRIPMDATELHLDGNDIPSLSSHTFIGRKYMKILHLNNSNIYTINNRTFNGLIALEVLNLSHNRLITLHGYEFERLVNLTELYLDHNRISTIANNTFAALTLLQILHIDHNYIVDFEIWNFNLNSHLMTIKMAANPWSCECHYIEPALDWVHSKVHLISDARYMECYYNETSGIPLLPKFNISSCTNLSARKMLAQRFQVENFVPIFVISGALLVIIVVIFIVILIINFFFKGESSRAHHASPETIHKHLNPLAHTHSLIHTTRGSVFNDDLRNVRNEWRKC